MPEQPTTVESLMSPQPVTVTSGDTLDQVLRLLVRYPFRHLPVVDGNELVGMLSDRDVCLAGGWSAAHGTPDAEQLAQSVANVMHSEVRTIAPSASTAEAARAMLDGRIGALPVLQQDVCVGILTATDLLRDLHDRCSRKGDHAPVCASHVAAAMTPEPVCVPPDEKVTRAARIAFERGVRHLPVVRDGELVGIFSDRDLRRAMAAEALAEACAELEDCEPPAGRVVEQDMTRGLLVLPPDATIVAAAHALSENRVGALPVVEDGRLVGLLTETDLLRLYLDLLEA